MRTHSLLVMTLALSTAAVAETAAPTSNPAANYDWRRTDLPAPAAAAIRLSTIGYTPEAVKAATVVAARAWAFRLVEAESGAEAFRGELSQAVRTAATDTDEEVRMADFSAFAKPGRYVLEVDGVGKSEPFAIGPQVWNEAFRLVTRGMYLWRCGTEVHAEWRGRTYHEAPCHLEDGLLDAVGGPTGAMRKGTGGWHDAGDYNKYVVNAGVTVGLMFKAWEQFRPGIEEVALDLPESGRGLPDLLAELKYEFDWLFTMQADDGSAYHKLTARDFRYWGPAEGDRSPRFFTPWGSTATADFAAMMALGARHFREFDTAYAERCLAAARRSWAFLVAHPGNHAPDQSGFHTGGYDVPDWSHRLWAAAELWETTGEPEFLAEFERRALSVEFSLHGPGWGDVRDLALGTYLTSHRPEGRNAALVRHLTGNLLAQAGRIVEACRVNLHGRPFGATRADFFWGCNGSVAAQTYLLHLADRLSPQPAPEYRLTAQQALVHLFGRNYHGRSYVTGLGANPPEHLHDRRGEPAWPGYLVGGPHPDARIYFDDWRDPSRNEIAINWNASLIYALAAFVAPAAK
ncbi:MAG TPA: glycoside hydrolase family 9 protein [Opitutaceae bacterium]|nr:glycoside hydrolase family 9 protein [Opitutaceae bacterium]